MSVTISLPDDDLVPPEIVSAVFHSATVSDSLALLVAETVRAEQRRGRSWTRTAESLPDPTARSAGGPG